MSLFGIPTLEETVGAIRAWAQTLPEESWVLGRGWIEQEWTDEQRFLTRDDVDPFTPTKPLFMPRADGVSALVNSRALELAGITKDTPDPEGGRFERDAEGEPTGYVLAQAMDPFRAIIPDDSDDYLRDNLIKGMKANASSAGPKRRTRAWLYRLVDLMKGSTTMGSWPTGFTPLSLFPRRRNSSAEAWKARTTTCSPSMASRSLSTARWAPGGRAHRKLRRRGPQRVYESHH